MELRTAFRNIHGDRRWWQKTLVGGALMLTLVGFPWVAGFAVESLDNAKRNFPTPLPPWHDWSTRYIIGLLALLIDFIFFVFPVLIAGVVLLCSGLIVTITNTSIGGTLVTAVVVVLALFEMIVFAIGVSPVGRLLYVDDGRIEEAVGGRTLQRALNPAQRGTFARARLRSLVGYIPVVVLGVLLWLSLRAGIPGAPLITLVLLWLAASALFYAHLLVVQLYAGAARSIR